MLFNTGEYILFYVCVLTGSWLLVSRPKVRIWLLLVASYYFYTAHNGWQVILILVCTVIDYFAGIAMSMAALSHRRKMFLIISLVGNLGMLGFFKYANFLADSFTSLADCFGARLSWVDLNITLPVGISFYTFHSMSYTIEVYRHKIPVERSWARFALFVSYFPPLIAGPIVRAANFLPQTHRRPSIDMTDLEQGLLNIFLGFFKKMVLADFLSVYADKAFGSLGQTDPIMAWMGVYAFSLQIYYDFSGYSDIAIGCSRLMGYQLPPNFRRPFVATSVSDFWRRWHISLSSWFRDYLYIPLGGDRMKTQCGVYRNLVLTMLLCGLWHGAGWHFLLWGLLHGLLLCGERIMGIGRQTSEQKTISLISLLKRFVVFNLITMTWSLFRCADIKQFCDLWFKMLAFDQALTVTYGTVLVAGLVICCWVTQYVTEYFDVAAVFLKLPIPLKAVAYGLTTIAVIAAKGNYTAPFIYFQF